MISQDLLFNAAAFGLMQRAEALMQRAEALMQRAEALMQRAEALTQRAEALTQRAETLMQNAARFTLIGYESYPRRCATIRTKSAALVRKDAAFCISAFGALHFQFAH